ncbi:MAG TPA: phage holin family protein [Chitinophagaceae bacterium]|nr:phage holin family protein [Chitinophagaceae bacterium]
METEEINETKEGLGESLNELTEHIGDYAQTFYKLAMVKLTRKAASAASVMIGVIAICTLGSIVLLFSSFGLSWWLGNVINNRAGGFLLVAGFWLLVLGIILAMRKSILFTYFRNIFIAKFHE